MSECHENLLVKMLKIIPRYLGDEDVQQKYVPMATVIAMQFMMTNPGWDAFIWQLALFAHLFPLAQKSKEKRKERHKLKRNGKWPPPMLPALVPYVTLDEDGKYCGPENLHNHPLQEEIRGWIYDAMAEEHQFSHEYIWNEVDSDYCF